MLLNNSRIKKNNGYRFYEKDVIFDDYVFTQNIQINVKLDYNIAGFGIVISDANYNISNRPNCYLFKIGYREASCYYATANSVSLVKQVSCIEAYTVQENLNLSLRKENNGITMYINDKKIFSTLINNVFDKYNIGYYSMPGNEIKDVNIATNIPEKWTINMKNTKGGYIDFLDDTFIFTDCEFNAEVEQSNILLSAGTYYVKYNISEDSDLKVYVVQSDDDRLYDEEKQLLEDDRFILNAPSLIDFKIVGKHGRISNMTITKDQDADYISTTVSGIDFDGSWLDIYINDLASIEWKGIIYNTPYKKADDTVYGVAADSKNILTPEYIGLLLKKEYNYFLDCRNFKLTIRDNDEIVFEYQFFNIIDKITIFKNMSAKITSLIITKLNGEIKDYVVQDDTNVKYVPMDITSPIICVDEYNIPLDLSASYRKRNGRYIFTNWEREIFASNSTIKLEKKVLNQQDVFQVYGIYDEIDLEKIYDIDSDINSIDKCVTRYDYIKESELVNFDKRQGIIYFSEAQKEKYKYFIVDYLKDSSYCINLDFKRRSYKVEVCSNTKTKLIYDADQKDNILISNKIKVTDIPVVTNGYVVLTGGR